MATQLNRKRAYSPPRFWESQFPQLKPNKSGTGQRLYRRRDVELAMEIKRLVHSEGYTLSGARAVLDAEQRRPAKRPGSVDPEAVVPSAARPNKSFDATAAVIGHARAELREIANLLASPAPQPLHRYCARFWIAVSDVAEKVNDPFPLFGGGLQSTRNRAILYPCAMSSPRSLNGTVNGSLPGLPRCRARMGRATP